uniref:glutaminyl-peptide cyclotransferase n=1 Tax=Sinocyclocheilus anshuiensis TaxID=1608454 RepID=A0A671RMD7_9TELE
MFTLLFSKKQMGTDCHAPKKKKPTIKYAISRGPRFISGCPLWTWQLWNNQSLGLPQQYAQVDGHRLWETHLRPLLIERVPGTAGSQTIRQHILSQLDSLSAGWTLEENSFVSSTPQGKVTFTNVLAVLDPTAPRRLLLACHHDSKILPADPKNPKRVFVGASDSAIPCAMILELATALDTQLKALKLITDYLSAVTLQLVFFDGEEAFEEWTETDSLYGSRHLAELMTRTPHPSGSTKTTLLQAVDLLVLLDLLGGPEPLIVNHFDNTARWFDRLITKRLHKQGLLTSHPSEQINSQTTYATIQKFCFKHINTKTIFHVFLKHFFHVKMLFFFTFYSSEKPVKKLTWFPQKY